MKKKNILTDYLSRLEDRKPYRSDPAPGLRDPGLKHSWCWLDEGWIFTIIEGFRTATLAEKLSILNVAREKHLGIIFVPNTDHITVENKLC